MAKTPQQMAAEEREKIDVTSSTDNKADDKSSDDKDAENKENEEGEQETDEENTEGEEGEKEEDKEEGDEEADDSAKDEDKEAAGDDKDKQIKKLEKTIERLQRRVGKTTAERQSIARELQEAKSALATAAEGVEVNEDEVNKRVSAKLEEREIEDIQSKIIKEGKALDKNFMTKVNAMAEEVQAIPGFMLGVLGDLDNGGAVLNYLTDNIDEYEELVKIKSPAKMTLALAKISTKIDEAKKPKAKAISKVPDPPKPIGGNKSSPSVLSDKDPMDEWIRKRNAQVEERRKTRMR